MAWTVEKIGVPKTENGYNFFHIHRFKQSHIDNNNQKIDICKKCGAERRSVFLSF